jgi:hypothetical protein
MESNFSHIKLSFYQIELLMECHERQIMALEPSLGPRLMKHSAALANYGLIMAKDYIKEGKKLTRFYITALGMEYLSQLQF